MSKLAILHYMPLEYYPPVTNLIDYIANNQLANFERIEVYSCENIKNRNPYNLSTTINEAHKKIELHRAPFPKNADNNVKRLYKYIYFNLVTLIRLVLFKPNNLLYFESYSAWPAYVYTKYVNRKCAIFIHNHEYASPEWYATTMRQVSYFHALEKKWLYPHAKWISETNNERLQLFRTDHPYLRVEQLEIMPNYPPRSWQQQVQQPPSPHQPLNLSTTQPLNPSTPHPLKLVYVGSLSFESTYIKEFCEWIMAMKGRFELNIYAYNLHTDVHNYLTELGSLFINYYSSGIEYNEQPNILTQNQVGVILYKPHDENYTYNAPNKLFEYLACNLDVWVPENIEGPKPYITKNISPKVIPVNFEDLTQFNWEEAIKRINLTQLSNVYFCEPIYEKLILKILKRETSKSKSHKTN